MRVHRFIVNSCSNDYAKQCLRLSDFRKACNIGSDAAANGENINDAIIANLNYRNKMAKEIPDGNKAVLELADLAFQLGFDTYNKSR